MAPLPMSGGRRATAVDLFCGAGGLTRGLLNAGIAVAAGFDNDAACKYAFEHNNAPARFYKRNVRTLRGGDLTQHFPAGHIRILVGCAPCITFSRYTQGLTRPRDRRWSLLRDFARLIRAVKPEIVSIENVPGLQHHEVFNQFLQTLDDERFHFSQNSAERIVYCPNFGIPQHRNRLVLLASRLGPINLVPPTHQPSECQTVADVLRSVPKLKAGCAHPDDDLHCSAALSALNLKRIRHSKPGGSWHDWPKCLVADCHREKTGKTYRSVYGRMAWNRPSPTITTQFYGFGNGRFGHPEQDRALSLREGAILQTFPKDYVFVKPGTKYFFKAIGRLIGNAVPVRLGEIIGRSIMDHLIKHAQ